MDKTTIVRFGDRDYPLNYSIEVMFRMEERYKDITAALDTIAGGGRASFEAVKWFFTAMANDGELCRRAAGYDERPFLEEDSITERMSPKAFAALRDAVVEAIRRGYETEIANSSGQFIDLGLMEIQRKKTKAGS